VIGMSVRGARGKKVAGDRGQLVVVAVLSHTDGKWVIQIRE
jgi:hypothetical protein